MSIDDKPPAEMPQDEAVERVARAMFDADDHHPDLWDALNWEGPEDYRRRARAALATLSADTEALRQVRELADAYERHARLMRAEVDSGGPLDVVMRSQAFEDAAANIHIALDGSGGERRWQEGRSCERCGGGVQSADDLCDGCAAYNDNRTIL